jgi:magnesium transporter
MLKVIQSTHRTNFVWIDLLNPTEQELQDIAKTYHLHPTSLQDILQPEHLPKFEQFEDIDFILCRYYDKDALSNADSILNISCKLSIFFRKDLVLTIHKKENKAYQLLTEKYQDNATINSYELVCKMVKMVMGTYEEPAHKLDEEIDFYESRIFLKKRIPDLIKNLYLIKRKLYILRKISNLSEAILDHLQQTSTLYKSRPQFQDLKDYYLKIDTMIEANYDDINNLLNIYISLSSQRTNEVMRTLTVFTAFFLPTTFIVGLYGMNFEFMPELHYRYGYPAVLLFMTAVTGIIYYWFKRKGWM